MRRTSVILFCLTLYDYATLTGGDDENKERAEGHAMTEFIVEVDSVPSADPPTWI